MCNHKDDNHAEALAEARAEAARYRRIAALVIDQAVGGRFVDVGDVEPCIGMTNNVWYTTPIPRMFPEVKGATDLGASFRDDADCVCIRCQQQRGPFRTRMNLCSVCGNKRCPKGTDHRNECSGSNSPGQIGSDYPARDDANSHTEPLPLDWTAPFSHLEPTPPHEPPPMSH